MKNLNKCRTCFLLLTFLFIQTFMTAQDTTGTAKILKLLPNPLQLNNGKLVKSEREWYKKRHPELLHFFTTEIYGQMPSSYPKMRFIITDENHSVFWWISYKKTNYRFV